MGPAQRQVNEGVSGQPDRRDVLHWVACMGAACLGGPLTLAQADSPLSIHKYSRTLLVDKYGRPFKTGQLSAGEPHIFNYPFETTPVFLMALPRAAARVELSDEKKHRYQSLPGSGPRHSIVAYSAICSHKLMYPTPQISFINIRKGQGDEPVHVVHCCGDNSRYDPTQGGRVISGPAPQPLAMIQLEWNSASDELHAVGTLGGEMFREFFEKYEFRLSMEHGPKARLRSAQTSVVQTAAAYSHQLQTCKA
ncbi:MAG: Rieske 2Fe-2S domain-containing protein [Rhizobacter sp.]|nr:Rieske 2Fe-2S domain-containing protein [Rhizobacter sp.]